MFSKLLINNNWLLAMAISLPLCTSCIEPFEFENEGERPVVIVEGHISDVSSQAFEDQFGEPNYFYVKLKHTGTVKNYIDEVISGAEVELQNDQNEFWDFTEDPSQPGTYYLYYPSFASQPNERYKVNIQLANGEQFESDFDQMPADDIRGEINTTETSKNRVVVQSREEVIRSFQGVDVNIRMPSISDNKLRYYRWDFLTTWMVVAEYLPRSHPQGVCWMDEVYFFDENVISRQKGPAGNVNLFFLETSRNQETKFGFAVRVRQQAMSEGYHQFWADLHNQQEQADLFAPPPYNVHSNIHAIGQDREVYGYFGVVNEEYYVWYFDKYSLSYVPKYTEECFVDPPTTPGEWCGNCLGRDGLKKGDRITSTQPTWWVY